MTDTYKVQLSDDLVAGMLLASHQQPRGGGGVQELVASAVKAGRQLGKLEALEPLDDAARAAVDGELVDLVAREGRHGWAQALRRLQGFLQRYPVRGRPEGVPEADGSPARTFPEVDVTVPPDLVQGIAAAKLVLDRFQDGAPFTVGDAARIAGVIEQWWAAAPAPEGKVAA